MAIFTAAARVPPSQVKDFLMANVCQSNCTLRIDNVFRPAGR
jgi:hypothetical protein